MGSKFFSFRCDPFSEGGKTNLKELSLTKVHSFSFNLRDNCYITRLIYNAICIVHGEGHNKYSEDN